MNEVEHYLSIVPLPVLLAIALVAPIGIFCIPSSRRMSALLVLLPPWLLINQFVELGYIQSLAKVTSIVMVASVALAAFLHPAAKRSIPPNSWTFVVFGLLGLIFVSRSEDARLAMFLQVHFVVTAAAGMFVARTIVDRRSLILVLRALYLGLVVSTLLLAVAVVVDPRSMNMEGITRFSPWGSNPNQISMQPAVTCVASIYLFTRHANANVRLIAMIIALTAFVVCTLTVSRSVALVILVAASPLYLHLLRSPFATVAVSVIGIVALAYVLSNVEISSFRRLLTLQSGRWQLFQAYMDEFMKRPVFGIFETSGMNSINPGTVRGHAHNSLLLVMYRGGIMYATVFLFIMGSSLMAALRTWRCRWRFDVDPTLMSVLATTLLAIYLHGFTHFANIWPTMLWCFLHVLIASTFFAWKRELQ